MPKYGAPNRSTYAVVLAHRVGGDPVAVAPVPVDQLGGDGGGRGQLVDQTQPRVLAQRVGRQRDRGPDLGQFGGLLEHVGPQAALPQCEAQGQPPDAGTDNGHPQTRFTHEAKPSDLDLTNRRVDPTSNGHIERAQ